MSTERNSFSVRLEELLKARYIKGDRTPRSSVLARIAMALGTTSEYLMEGVPQSYVDEIGYAKRLIARNVDQMTTAEKREILSILLGDREG